MSFSEQITRTLQGEKLVLNFMGSEDAPALLLIPPDPNQKSPPREVFERLVKNLSSRYRVIIPHLPVFEDAPADRPKHFDAAVDGFSDSVVSFLQTLGIHKFHLFMQEYGSPVGMSIASRYWLMIEALEVIDYWIEGRAPQRFMSRNTLAEYLGGRIHQSIRSWRSRGSLKYSHAA